MVAYPETGNRTVDGNVDYSSELDKITTDIKNLTDAPEDNDTQAMENLKTSLNENFLSGIADFLNKPVNEGQKTKLVNSVKDVLSKHKEDENFCDEYKSLIDLALALEIYGSVEQVAEDEAKPSLKKPEDLEFQGEINDIPEPTEDEKNNRKFFNNIDKKLDHAPESEKSDLETFEDGIRENLAAINTLLASGLDGSQKANLGKIKSDLENVLNVMGNPNKDNTRKLQSFILQNLDEDSQEQFKKDNHFREGRGDGDFGIKTLEGLQKVLSKIEDHLNSLKDYLKAIDDNKKNEILDNLKNGEKTFKKGGTSEEFINSLELPEGVTAIFASEEEEAKLNNEGLQEIKLKVTVGDKTYDVTVKLNITSDDTDVDTATATESAGDGAVDSTPEGQVTSTEPITVEGGQHLVMRNSGELASKYNLSGAIFYSSDVYEGVEGEEMQPKLSESTAENDGESEYFVKFNNIGNIFKIRVDKNGGLCPIATEYDQMVNGMENRVLVKNNGCCVNYLQNKLGNIPGAIIQRNGDVEDYTIKSFGNELTIEPMTIDKKWVSEDLGVCLKMLNFTNFLMSGTDSNLKGTDPNLRLRNNKLQVQTIRGWGDINLDFLSKFGLFPFNDGDMKRFIKYNNHEDWNDNWDRKKPNRIYKKLDVSGRAQILGGSEAAPQTAGRRFSAGSTGVGAGSVDVAPAQTDDTAGSTEVVGDVLDQSVLLGLLNGIKFNDLGTMRSSGYGYQMFEFNNVKTEGAKEGDDSGNTKSGNESNDESGNKYIEIGGHKFMEATDNFTGLGYKVTVHGVYIGEFKDGQKNGIGIDAPSTNDLNRPTYIGNFEKGLYNGNGKLELDGNSYEGEFKNGLGEGAGEFTWANGNKFKGTFYNPLGEGYLKFQTTNNNGSFERVVINLSNGQAMYVDNFFIGEMKSGSLTIDGKDYEVTDGKYTTESGETKEIPHP